VPSRRASHELCYTPLHGLKTLGVRQSFALDDVVQLLKPEHVCTNAIRAQVYHSRTTDIVNCVAKLLKVCAKDCNKPLRDNQPNIYSNNSGVGFAAANIIGSSATTLLLSDWDLGGVPASDVVMVRYVIDDYPSLFVGTQPAVYNAEGLPATPGAYNVTA
jgi:hypothetical protein